VESSHAGEPGEPCRRGSYPRGELEGTWKPEESDGAKPTSQPEMLFLGLLYKKETFVLFNHCTTVLLVVAADSFPN
jgi:hypothetical protein